MFKKLFNRKPKKVSVSGPAGPEILGNTVSGPVGIELPARVKNTPLHSKVVPESIRTAKVVDEAESQVSKQRRLDESNDSSSLVSSLLAPENIVTFDSGWQNPPTSTETGNFDPGGSR